MESRATCDREEYSSWQRRIPESESKPLKEEGKEAEGTHDIVLLEEVTIYCAKDFADCEDGRELYFGWV